MSESILAWLSLEAGEILDSWVDDAAILRAITAICQLADVNYFRLLDNVPSIPQSLVALLICHYFKDRLSLELPPDLAQSCLHDTEALGLLTLCLAVQSEQNARFVANVQQMEEKAQQSLMSSIESVTSRLGKVKEEPLDMQPVSSEEVRLLQSQCHSLLSALQMHMHGSLKGSSQSSPALEEWHEEKSKYQDEIHRLTSDLHAAQDELAIAEESLSQTSSQIANLEVSLKEALEKNRQLEPLKDQLDEFKHTSSKLNKAENTLEKYKKKLEEANDLKRSVKTLEEENATLVNETAKLRDEVHKISSAKALLDTYKSQVTSCDTEITRLRTEVAALKAENDHSAAALSAAEQLRMQQAETIEVYTERLKELDTAYSRKRSHNETDSVADNTDDDAAPITSLEDSYTSSMTNLRFQVKRLQEQLSERQKSNTNTPNETVPETQSLDVDLAGSGEQANSTKQHGAGVESRRPSYLSPVKEQVKSSSDLIIELRQRLIDSDNHISALLIRLGQTEPELELKKEQLSLAESDLALIDKDQLHVLSTLRETVSREKSNSETEMKELKAQLQTAKMQERTLVMQVNKLLSDLVRLQAGSIDQKNEMLLKSEQLTNLRIELSNKDNLSPGDCARITAFENEMNARSQQVLELQSTLTEVHAALQAQAKGKVEMEEKSANVNLIAQKAQLEERVRELEAEVEKTLSAKMDVELRSRKEQQLMVQAWQKIGFDRLQRVAREADSSWLMQQRFRTGL